jgi:hypothetical protein
MESRPTYFAGCTTEESKLLDGIIETDALIETQLTGLESLLERQGDAMLELAQLRELRLSCERLRELLGQGEKSSIERAIASR